MQVTSCPVAEQTHPSPVALTYASPVGSGSVTETPSAVEGPRLVTSRVKSSSSPITAVPVCDFTIARSAITPTTTVSLAVLLSSLISLVPLLTVATFVYLPAATDSETWTTISNGVRDAPGTSGCVLAEVHVTSWPVGVGTPARRSSPGRQRRR